MSEAQASLPASRLLAMQEDIQPGEFELTEENCQIGRLPPCQTTTGAPCTVSFVRNRASGPKTERYRPQT